MARTKFQPPKRIALRLADGSSRRRIGVGWPPSMIETADLIAAAKGESRSWAMEQLMNRAMQQAVSKVNDDLGTRIRYETPEYTPRKKKSV